MAMGDGEVGAGATPDGRTFMNRAQRTRHVWMWAVLGPLAMLLLVAAVMVRRVPLGESAHPADSRDAAQKGTP